MASKSSLSLMLRTLEPVSLSETSSEPLEGRTRTGRENAAACPWKPLPTLLLPKQWAALCLWTILSLHKYSSEGFCLNKGKVKQLNCQTDNIQFSALSSMYSLKSVSHRGSLSGSSPLLNHSFHES